MKRLIFRAFVFILASSAAFADNSRLPDGTEFPLWEQPLHFSKTYYVDGKARNGDDSGPGTKDHPFRTINHAAQILQPGERVVIASGVYREAIRPARGGNGPGTMISYEAAPGANVEVKGSAIVTAWQPSEGWNFGRDTETHQPVTPWELHLEASLFPTGYNPFALDNVTDNRYWINYAKDNMSNYFRRRGLVFVDGKPLEPVEGPGDLAGPSPRSLNFFSDLHWAPLFQEFSPYAGKVWIESDGLTLHIRLANDDAPSKHNIEITNQESVFSPAKPYQTYIRVKGITFEYAGNSYPNPQRGLVSTNHGNHFIFEDDTFEWANSVGLDIGDVDWRLPNRLSPWASTSCDTMCSATAELKASEEPAVPKMYWWRRTFSNGSAGRTRRGCPNPAVPRCTAPTICFFATILFATFGMPMASGWISATGTTASQATSSPIFRAT